MFFEWKERLDNMEKERLEIVSSPMYQMMNDIKSIIDEDPEIRKAFEESPVEKEKLPVEESLDDLEEDSAVKERWENENEDDWEYLISGKKPREDDDGEVLDNYERRYLQDNSDEYTPPSEELQTVDQAQLITKEDVDVANAARANVDKKIEEAVEAKNTVMESEGTVSTQVDIPEESEVERLMRVSYAYADEVLLANGIRGDYVPTVEDIKIIGNMAYIH
jgi:hypothetical protein